MHRNSIILLRLTLVLQRNWAHRNTQSQEDNPTKKHHQDLGHDSAFTVSKLQVACHSKGS
ncbi:5091_t:CDS:2 [Funneliformis caledonium]|uniref:5091_t:CDS:1 n=1 Tax=Funneliformis caledonium TaxID=1117310 RepID=A0A9N9EPX7_9GLOM|nr:5091_t:CDS:2 [Funneliformis caledonium]